MINMLNIKEAILELFNEEELISQEDFDSAIQDAIDYINGDISLTPSEPVVVPPPTITLTVSDDILSYADNDSTVCTVTAVGETDGYSIRWYKNNSYLTTTTFSNNTTSYTYNSQGEGNVTIRAELVNNVNTVITSETSDIEDCFVYMSNPSNSSGLNISLPSQAIVSFKMTKSGFVDGKGGSDILLGDDSNHNYFVGNWASAGNNGFIIRNNGSSTNLVLETTSDIALNTEYTLGVTYNNGDWTYFKNDEIISFSANYTPTKLTRIDIGQQSTMSDLKVKPIPQFDVTTNKNILSYSDNDTTTLTATYTHTDTTDYTVEWYNGSTLLGSSSFVGDTASYVYEGTGIGDVEVTAKVVDTNESIIVTDSIVLEDYIFAPTLDSNREIYQINGTTTISNNELSNGSCKLLPSFSNSGDWELSFKVKFSGWNCCAMIMPSNETSRDSNELLVTAYHNGISWYNNGTFTENQLSSNLSSDTYYDCTITKNDSNITVNIGSHTQTTSAWNGINAEELCLGIGGWSSSGNVCTVKDIVVKHIPSVSVSTTKNILSYMDTDNTTLTATVDGSIYDSVVKWYNGNTLLSTSQLTTNTVTYTYNSSGSGDVTIMAELVRDNTTLSSDEILLEDCYYYDDMSTDKTSSYNSLLNNNSKSYNTDCIVFNNTNGGFSGLSPCSVSSSNHYLFEVDVKTSGTGGTIHGTILCLQNNHYISLSLYDSSIGVYDYGSGSQWMFQQTSVSYTISEYHHISMEVDGDKMSVNVYDSNNNLIYSKIGFTLPSEYRNNTIQFAPTSYRLGDGTTTTVSFKNYKIKLMGE